uniref:Sulfotransferase domain-containing protein n=1 Tax=Noctiluca scintillans TaxID=2966 RepID=A0A7S1ANX6_NOCSC|mmetsp:Transcript_53778/g.143955  ORF Transcript_53778/g.143955 Transcript_53778/m.143955 type:complete len:315 (+) Transcript_53778:61-1005(+)
MNPFSLSALGVLANETFLGPLDRMTVHMFGQGFTGSSFLGNLFDDEGLLYLFEPENREGWGLWQSEDALAQSVSRVHCIHTCANCQGEVADEEFMAKMCSDYPVVVKTVGMSDVDVFSGITKAQLNNAKFVLTLRDPRAVVWQLHKDGLNSGPVSCYHSLLQLLSSKKLAKSMKPYQVRAVFFEQWSQHLNTFVPDLFKWLNLTVSASTLDFANSFEKVDPLEWTNERKTIVSGDIIDVVDKAPFCQTYMGMLGYPRNPTPDFTKLLDPFKTPITEAEETMLLKLRQEQKKFETLDKFAKLPVFLMNEPEPRGL